MKPATPLPWEFNVGERPRFGIVGSAYLPAKEPCMRNAETDAAYIAHAANAYPKLIEALRALLERGSIWQKDEHVARDLLRELGEVE